jgi:4-amino-4-deoxy-L-arabinose transferase-like glycosyltransferase
VSTRRNPRFGTQPFGRLLLVVIVLALAVRVGYVVGAKRGPCFVSFKIGFIPTQCPRGDQLFYNGEANRLALGDGFVNWAIRGSHSPPAADHPPLTVVVLMPMAWLNMHWPLTSIHDPTAVTVERYYMAALGTLLVFLIGLLGRRLGGDRVGLVAALLAALYPNLWVNDGLIMSETVTGIVVVSALILAYRLRDRPRIATAIACGAACGLVVLARVEFGLLVPLLAVPAALAARGANRKRHLTLAAAAVAAAVIVVAPWVIYNESRFADTTFVSTNDGLTLAGANCALVYSGRTIGLWVLQPPCIGDPRPAGDQSQVSAAYRHRAFDYIRAHKSRVPVVVAARIGRTWGVFRPRDMLFYNVGEGREKWVTELGLITYYPLAVLAVAGGWILARRRRGLLWPLLVPAVAVTVAVALTYGQTRFRAAAEPSIVLLAAVALVALWTRVRRVSVRAEAEAAVTS